MRIASVVGVAGMLIVAAGACGGDGSGPSSAEPAPIGGEGVRVGNILFRSNHNGSSNPAVDTVAAGATVEWTWVSTGSVPHSVRSTGSPSFTSSAIMSGGGTTYSLAFTTPGVYTYDCAVHGAAMTGRIVVQ